MSDLGGTTWIRSLIGSHPPYQCKSASTQFGRGGRQGAEYLAISEGLKYLILKT